MPGPANTAIAHRANHPAPPHSSPPATPATAPDAAATTGSPSARRHDEPRPRCESGPRTPPGCRHSIPVAPDQRRTPTPARCEVSPTRPEPYLQIPDRWTNGPTAAPAPPPAHGTETQSPPEKAPRLPPPPSGRAPAQSARRTDPESPRHSHTAPAG